MASLHSRNIYWAHTVCQGNHGPGSPCPHNAGKVRETDPTKQVRK